MFAVALMVVGTQSAFAGYGGSRHVTPAPVVEPAPVVSSSGGSPSYVAPVVNTPAPVVAPVITPAPVGQVLGVSTFSFNSDLRQGMSGDDVRQLQTQLQTQGLFNGPISGYFGPLTLAAVKAHQAANNLPQTGYVGPLTRGVLNSSTPVAAAPSTGNVLGVSTFSFNSDLRQGMSGNDVTQLQTKLTSEGVYTGPITGTFGTLTLKAVKAYQASKGLPQTGFVGTLTRAQLNQ